MREYYARFFGEMWKEFSLFGKEQVVVVLSAAIIQIIREGQAKTIGAGAVIPSIEAAVGGYLIVCVMKLVWIALHAPVKIDKLRKDEILAKENSLTIASAKEAELTQLLSLKHPRDEAREEMVASVFREEDRKFLTWLLHAGKSSRQAIAAAGFGNMAQEVRNRTASIHLVSVEVIPADHSLRGESYYQINPQFNTALTNLLYPPPRPVVPPSVQNE